VSSYLSVIFPTVAIFLIGLFYMYYIRAVSPREGTTEWIGRTMERPRFTMSFRLHKMERRDVLPVLIITLVSAFLGFFRLGDTVAPQSFHRFKSDQKTVTITLDETREIGKFYYYTGLWIGSYTLEFSEDGHLWIEPPPSEGQQRVMNQPHGDLFKWREASISGLPIAARYIRITASSAPLELGEIAVFTADGALLSADKLSCPEAPALLDEQSLVPDAPTYLNSMYFDEIYHGRTAYEYLNGIKPYESTHPPLGKAIISVGIALFGMTPFGWRFIGTLFGVLMIPILYILIKNMFGKTRVAVCATLLFAFDFMRFTQTRIATIDTYGVFFILLSYLFMYRYATQDEDVPFRKTLPPLALSGLFFGIGCASKWVVVYAGFGLLALYLITQIRRILYYHRNEMPGLGGYIVKTLVFSVIFYILVPAAIYCLSYIPYAYGYGYRLEFGMLRNKNFYRMIWDNQTYMFRYHSRLVDTHPYSSNWYQWIVDGRPILYYSRLLNGGTVKSAFAAFGNPALWWGGFAAIVAMAVHFIRRRDGKALFILIGYLSQLLPWIIIPRIVFIYHYFPSTLFLTLAMAYVFNTIFERGYGRYRRAVYGYTAATILLFIMFYPVLTGAPAPVFYTTYFLRWFPGAWPF